MGEILHLRLHPEVEKKMRNMVQDVGGTLTHHVNEAIKEYLEENRDLILASEAVLRHCISKQEARKILASSKNLIDSEPSVLT